MAAGTETLKRTPLHDRHAAAGARLVPFAGLGDAGAVRRDPRGARGGADEASACSTSATWARSRRAGRSAEAFLQRILSNDVAKIAEDGAQYSRAVQGRRRGARRPLHLPPRARPLPDRHQRVEPREGPRVVPAARGRTSTSTSRTGCTTTRCSRSRARTPARSSQALADGELPKRFRTATLTRRRRARRPRRRHRLHGRGRRRAAARARARAPRSGTR